MTAATTTDPFAYIIPIYNFIFGNGSQSPLSSIAQQWMYVFINFYARFAVFSILLSIALLVVVVFAARKFGATRESFMAQTVLKDNTTDVDADETIENKKWTLIQEHIGSEDASKWRLAILEADIMLADLLDTMSLPGDSIGDKLKAVESTDFKQIEAAWEAHKIRNAIAHEGSDFLLTQREAKRVIGLYQSVFREFEVIS